VQSFKGCQASVCSIVFLAWISTHNKLSHTQEFMQRVQKDCDLLIGKEELYIRSPTNHLERMPARCTKHWLSSAPVI
jgi:hypothetical protein